MQQILKKYILQEERRGIEKYGYHHSPHEAYGVLLEEAEEARDNLEEISHHLELLWHEVKNGKENTVSTLHTEAIERYAIHLAKKAIQVAAMARKFHKRGSEALNTDHKAER